ncbi:MAG: 4Fe-4S dicluster domain-containing protein [Phycisphaerales bacterium]|nr:MAG: 4Fe-4S dicluster domain-containing protein [Phycisphaerales bacterium]
MRFRGGYDILLQGRPEGLVRPMPEPATLYLPLRSPRFTFTEICVRHGQDVKAGDPLARDRRNHGVPLLAPRSGRVNLESAENHTVLEQAVKLQQPSDPARKQMSHIERESGAAVMRQRQLLALGAWQFFYDAHTGALPDPTGSPQAIIVCTLGLEPFVTRGDVQLRSRLLNFTRGLEHLQSLLEYQPIFLAIPDIRSDFADIIRNRIRGYASVKILAVPLTYPYDNFRILARRLGLKRSNGPVWALRTEGILAVDRALTLTKPCLVRIVSIGGAGVVPATHIKVMPGYPLKMIKEKYVFEPVARIINGGILTGETLGEQTLGLDAECRGLTVLPEQEGREFLGFTRPGWGRSAYAPCFLSSLRQRFRERFSTGMRGEGRPCISCNYCEDVCPAGIAPHLIHKYLYRGLIDGAERARVDLCVECGLCSFVCPSKIDLRRQFFEVKQLIHDEKQAICEEKARLEAVREAGK